MRSLAEYISEAMQTQWQMGTTIDFIDNGAWIPNDDLSKDDYKAIANAFYKKYPANLNDCGVILDTEVKCEIKYIDGEECVKFTFYWGNLPKNKRIDVLEEIIDLLTNTIYSVKGGKPEIKKLLDNMSA